MGENSDRGEVKEDSREGSTIAITHSNFKLIKGQSLVSIWHLYRVWNTTDLLCACHRDKEAVQEEE